MNEKSETNQGHLLTLERLVNAPRERVFEAWTDTAMLSQWFGPEGVNTRYEVNDVRPGGAYALVMESKTTDATYALSGEYVEVTPHSRLVYTWQWKDDPIVSQIELDFIPRDDQTEIRLTQRGFTRREAVDSHGEGWISSFDALDTFLA